MDSSEKCFCVLIVTIGVVVCVAVFAYQWKAVKAMQYGYNESSRMGSNESAYVKEGGK